MPIFLYECKAGHRTEKLILPRVDKTVEEQKPQSLKCEQCPGRARPVAATRIGHNMEMFFGSRYGFAGPASRDAWHKALDVKGWTGPGT